MEPKGSPFDTLIKRLPRGGLLGAHAGLHATLRVLRVSTWTVWMSFVSFGGRCWSHFGSMLGLFWINFGPEIIRNGFRRASESSLDFRSILGSILEVYAG